MRKDGILLFINATLGICLGAGIATFISQILVIVKTESFSHNSIWLLIFLFLIYVTNILRTFLGFVKFYQEDSLYDPSYNLIANKDTLIIYRMIDFLMMMLITLTLISQGFVIHIFIAFAWIFFISSCLFVLRNMILTMAFTYLENKSKKLESEIDKLEIKGRNKTTKRWLILDLIFLLPSIVMLFGIKPNESDQQLFFGASAMTLLFLSGVDIWINRKFYFESALDAGN